MPLATLEVRWFFAGPLEAGGSGMEAWFRTRPPFGGGRSRPLAWEPTPPAWRPDRYLLVPDHDDMGIKWREGRLEIKGREEALGHRAFAPGIEGVCERWLKWSYIGARIERRWRGLFHDGAPGIVVVEKRRLQRHLRLDPSGAVAEVGPDQQREHGINVELAQIRIRGHHSKLTGRWGSKPHPPIRTRANGSLRSSRASSKAALRCRSPRTARCPTPAGCSGSTGRPEL